MPTRHTVTLLATFTGALALAAGSAWAAGGDLDPTFSGDGRVTTTFFTDGSTSATVYALATAPDGKIVAAGSASSAQNPTGGATFEFALARYHPDGSLDSGFSGDGKVTTDIFGGHDSAYAVAVQPDGKVVAAGAANINAASFFNNVTLVRYTTNGGLDSTFGSGGKVSTDFFGGNSEATSMTLLADGRIVVAGFAHDGIANRFAVARYLSNGSLDASFGVGGKVTTSFFGFDDRAADVGVQADGKIVVVGHVYPGGANDQFAVARYDINGNLDTSFGAGGKVTTDFFGANDLGQALVLQPDGKIVAGGTAAVPGAGIDHYALARYDANGNLDTSFGVGGKATIEFSSAWARSLSAVGQPDGKIVTASWGVDSASGFDHFQLARFNTNGTLDASFSGDGKLTTTFLASQNQAYALAIQPDGRLLAAGTAADIGVPYMSFALARYEIGGAAPSTSLASLAVNPTSVTGGSVSTGTVTLIAAAPAGGATVTLTDNSAAVTVPASVTVAAGATDASFTATTTAVSASTPVSVTGSYGGVSRSATLTVTAAAAPAAPSLVTPANAASVAQPVAFDWIDVAAATEYEIQIDSTSTITAPYTASQTASVSQASVGNLPTQQLWWRVRARNAAGTWGPYSATRRFTPQTSTVAGLSSVSLSPASVVGGNSVTGTVTLTGAAPSGGAVVSLSSNSGAATVPAGVTVPAGATSATFTITTNSVTSASSATITAQYAGLTRTATLTVNPPGANATLSVTASGRSGHRITSNPTGIDVTVGSTQSAAFATNTSITLSVSNGRQAIWSGACSSGGNKTATCTFTLTANATVTANVQ
jgi:uncharacterized delta-60 repeat protein